MSIAPPTAFTPTTFLGGDADQNIPYGHHLYDDWPQRQPTPADKLVSELCSTAANSSRQTVSPCDIDVAHEGPYTLEQETQRVAIVASRMEGFADLGSLVLQSNCTSVSSLCAIVNQSKVIRHHRSIVGKLVKEGHLSFVECEGETTVCGPGRFVLWNVRASWSQNGTCFSMAHIHAKPIRVGAITVFRVPAGHYGLVRIGNEPFLVTPDNGGLYAVNDPSFQFVKFVRIDEQYIQHDTIHIIRISKGSYGCAKQNNIPVFLPAGIHTFKTADFQFVKFESLSQNCIKFETLTRFYVPRGRIGLAWRDSDAVFFQERGVYLVDSAMFRFVSFADIDSPEIQLGSKKIITVKEGLVGVSHVRGQLKILRPGRHVIDEAEHVFDEFLSTQQMSLVLRKNDRLKSASMICETRELVKIGIQASVFYNIEDPSIAVVKIGSRKQIETFINETATAVITTIIRTTSLAEIAQSGRSKQGTEVEDEFSMNVAFFDKLQSSFIERLQQNFLREYGICMQSVRVGDFKVLDWSIGRSIAKHASTTAATQAKLANLEGNRRIDLVSKECDMKIERIQEDVNADKEILRARANAQSLLQRAQANADALLIEASARLEKTKCEAEAIATSIRVVGAAEADALRVVSSAEVSRAERLGSSFFGRELSLAQIRASMVSGSMSGVQKVVYLPTEMQGNPFSLMQASHAPKLLLASSINQ